MSSPPLSLAVHPDGVRVASGQTAGVDKDGKVRPKSNPGRQDEILAQLSFTPLTPSLAAAPAACGSCLGLRDTAEAAGDRTRGVRAGRGGPGLFSCGEWPKASGPASFLSDSPLLIHHQEASDVLSFLTPARPVFLRREHVFTSPSLPACDGVSCLVTMNSQPLPSLSPSTLSPSSGSGCFSLCGG